MVPVVERRQRLLVAARSRRSRLLRSSIGSVIRPCREVRGHGSSGHASPAWSACIARADDGFSCGGCEKKRLFEKFVRHGLREIAPVGSRALHSDGAPDRLSD
jgi:hypothetical protein